MVAFVYVPAATGAILCLVVVRFVPRRRLAVAVAAGLAVVLGAIGVSWWLVHCAGQRTC